MKLTSLRLQNFRCFGEIPTTLSMRRTTFLLGPNGSGKTAALQALTRMFGFDRALRRIQKADFHVPNDATAKGEISAATLWIEADFQFPELKTAEGKHSAVPSNFAHMRLETKDGVPKVRFRSDAQLDSDGEIDEKLTYVLEVDEDGKPTKRADVPKHDRASIQVHYLPARRDPTDHISYAATSLLGRVLRAANWKKENTAIAELTEKITVALAGNEAVVSINEFISASWTGLHKGSFYAEPHVSFGQSQIEGLLKHLTLTFSPGHEEAAVEFSRLGDGQKSLLYLSLVLAVQDLGRQLLKGELKGWDIDRLQPAIFSLVAMEEPENSLSPHYLGRIVRCLSEFADNDDAQAIVATHSPALLRRVVPERIRYFRLNAERETVVKKIIMPSKDTDVDAYKFVREAVQAYPELYFSRIVVLGEGDSEEIVIPQLFQARGIDSDASMISVVPLGGRHVNHFWRLLHGLEIPYITLLDLDLGRHQGGWGRVRYAATQLSQYPAEGNVIKQSEIAALPKWNGPDEILKSSLGKKWLADLESHGVFFAAPLDLDFAMLENFGSAYGLEQDELVESDEKILAAVLGQKHHGEDQYSSDQLEQFRAYHKRFKLGSKPAAHLSAMANLDAVTLKGNTPPSIARLLKAVGKKLDGLDE
jgi:putative ATP-dependent endonuclease of the OLD family